jgi:hypothetical protein
MFQFPTVSKFTLEYRENILGTKNDAILSITYLALISSVQTHTCAKVAKKCLQGV